MRPTTLSQFPQMKATTLGAFKRQFWRTTRLGAPSTVPKVHACPGPPLRRCPGQPCGVMSTGVASNSKAAVPAGTLSQERFEAVAGEKAGETTPQPAARPHEEQGTKRWPSEWLGRTAKRWRSDLPKRLGPKVRLKQDETAGDVEACKEVLNEAHTTTSAKSIRGRLVWWERKAAKRGFAPFPLTEKKLALAAA